MPVTGVVYVAERLVRSPFHVTLQEHEPRAKKHGVFKCRFMPSCD